MTAAQNALEITELLEGILVHLPPKDILLAQRVSKYWQAVIKGSRDLQQLLFLKPVDAPVLVHSKRRKCTLCFAQLECADLSIVSNEENSQSPQKVLRLDCWVDPTTNECMSVVANPMLGPLIASSREHPGEYIFTHLPAAWSRAEASWRGMLCTQPPAKMALNVVREYNNEMVFSVEASYDVEGIRATDLEHKISQIIGQGSGLKCSKMHLIGQDTLERFETSAQIRSLPRPNQAGYRTLSVITLE